MQSMGLESLNLISKVKNIDGRLPVRGILRKPDDEEKGVNDLKPGLKEDGSNVNQNGVGDDENSKPISYASKLTDAVKPKVNFRHLESLEKVDEADVVLPRQSIKNMRNKFANTLVGYFLCNRLAFPVVD